MESKKKLSIVKEPPATPDRATPKAAIISNWFYKTKLKKSFKKHICLKQIQQNQKNNL